MAKAARSIGAVSSISCPGYIPDGARVHYSVFLRKDAGIGYAPINLPPRDKVQIEPADFYNTT
jgi:hypothetical protein